MAHALARGLVEQGVVAASDLMASCPSNGPSREAFLTDFPADTVRWTADNLDVVRTSDLIVLAIKPQVMDAVLPEIQEVSAGKLIVSIAAGITLARLESGLHPQARVVRCMPNTPMLVGAGASAYALGTRATDEDAASVQALLDAGGLARRVEEAHLDAVTALSGSGPAYVFHFIEALTDGGIALGLAPDMARDLAVQTVAGSAKMVAETGENPGDLAANVKSPGGTTIAACDVLEAAGFHEIITSAMEAAHRRAGELARGD